jgi:16S rRNA (adenine1518-N6/adenine1519-N6)-dimethyltransferase
MMTARELRDLLASLGIHPSRRLGQNFMIDANLLTALVRDAAPQPGQEILEVGPGTGVLTRLLLAAGAKVTAIELDHRLAAYLRTALGDQAGFRLVEGDACRTDYANLFGTTPFRCIANLPYSCSSVFLAAMADLENAPTDLYVLLQREMAERLGATAGSKEYGALTVRLQLRYSVSVIRSVPPQVFWPAPEVGSSWMRLVRHDDSGPLALCRRAGELAAVAFSQRRKKASKVLAERLGGIAATQALFARAALSPEARAEEFSPADFVRLAVCLQDQSSAY